MVPERNLNWLANVVICLLLLTTGCTQPIGEAAKPEVGLQSPGAATTESATLALKFIPQDSTTYRVVTLTEQQVKWEGLPDGADFKGGRNDNRIVMTFTQQIQSVDDKGNAIAKITIERLKYFSVIKDNLILDFDNSREEDRDNPLAKLIGQSYTIEIAPTGKVTRVIDVKQARAAVKGGYMADKAALKLFTPDEIKERHGLIDLPATDKNRLCPGDNWSGIETFFFGTMGSKSYEKIYTLKGIEERDNRQVAVVEMNAIPSSEMAEQLHKEQTTFDYSKLFDNIETYAGRLKLDLTAGKVEEYREKLQLEWIRAELSAERGDDKEPIVLTMSTTRLYSLEKID